MLVLKYSVETSHDLHAPHQHGTGILSLFLHVREKPDKPIRGTVTLAFNMISWDPPDSKKFSDKLTIMMYILENNPGKIERQI